MCVVVQGSHFSKTHGADKGAQLLIQRFSVAKRFSRLEGSELDNAVCNALPSDHPTRGALTLTNEWYAEQGLDPECGWLGVVTPPSYRPDAFSPGDVSTPLARAKWVQDIKLKAECKAKLRQVINGHFKTTNKDDLDREDLVKLLDADYNEALVDQSVKELIARGEKFTTDVDASDWTCVVAGANWTIPPDIVD